MKSLSIICFPTSKKTSRINDLKKFRRLKFSAQSRARNYKPYKRYGFSDKSCTLQSAKNTTNQLENSVLICNTCTASFFCKSFFHKNLDNCCQRKTPIRVFEVHKNYHDKNSYQLKMLPPQLMPEINFLHLLGPSSRCLYVRKKINFLINNKNISVRLCQIRSLNININELGKVKLAITKSCIKKNMNKCVFDVITNDGINIKLKPLQLKKPKIIVGFLNSFFNKK